MSKKKIIFTFTGSEKKSLDFLYLKKSQLAGKRFDQMLNDLINEETYLKGFEHHAITIRKKVITTLRSHGFFLGSETIDEIIYYTMLAVEKQNFEIELHDFLKNKNFLQECLVLFPLHSFGILGFGLLDFLANQQNKKLKFHCSPASGISIIAQAKSLDGFCNDLKEVCSSHHFRKPTAQTLDLLAHFHRSRNLKWLTTNPLIFFKFKMSKSGSNRFENEYFIRKFFDLNMTLMYTYFLYDKSHGVSQKFQTHFSSANTNNYETLNIHHYMIFSKDGNRQLSCDCIPLHDKKLMTIYSTCLDIEVWKTRPTIQKIINPLKDILIKLFIEKYSARATSQQEIKKQRLIDKVLTSLEFYKESFNAVFEYEKIVNLNTAFEVLLIDYEGAQNQSTGNEIARRIYKLCRKPNSKRRYLELYFERNKIIHNGSKNDQSPVHLEFMQRVYIECFINLYDLISKLASIPNEPVKQLLAN